MKAAARVVVERHDGRDEVVRRDAEAPLSVRRCGDRVLLAASAAAPVGGDDLHVGVVVGDDARAEIGTVAATLVWPSPVAAWSSTTTTCDVAERADLVWWPEPTVSVARSMHRATTIVRLAATATCTIVEEIALGRSGEQPGVLELDLRVQRAPGERDAGCDARCDAPLVHHRETFGRGSSSVGVGSARFAVSVVLVGVSAGTSRTSVSATTAAAWLPVADDVVVVLAVGSDRVSVWQDLAEVAPDLSARRPSPTNRRTAMVRPSDQSASEGYDAHRT